MFDFDNDIVILEIDVFLFGVNFNSMIGYFDWMLINVINIILDFVVIDLKNVLLVFMVIINMCKCENDGECDFL